MNPRALTTLSICLLSLLLLSCGKGKSDAPAADKPAAGKESKDGKGDSKGGGRKASLSGVVIAKVSLQPEVRGIATVIPGEVVDVKSEIQGRITSLGFKDGESVAKGALLAKINDADLQASRSKAQARIELLKSTLERKKQQLELQAISQQDLDQAANDLVSAQADLALLEAQLAKTEIRAPFAGNVGLSRVVVGQVVSAGQSIANLVQPNPLKVELNVPGEKAEYAKVGQVLKVRSANGFESKARIYATDGNLDLGTRTLAVRALVEGKSAGLVPGAAVDFSLEIPAVEAMLVPPEALAGDAEGAIVYLLKGGKAAVARVKVGRRTVDQVQLVDGVQVGDTVLCVGAANVRPGMPVDITEIRE